VGNLNIWEIMLLVLLALFIFGPDRLPKLVTDAIRLLRRVRSMARDATDGLSRELGTQVTLEDLHPKTFIRKHVLSDDEQSALRRPFDDLARDLRSTESDVRRAASDVRSTVDSTPGEQRASEATPVEQPRRHQPDPDAT
jgi:sec-independent protein translocase protein TatB